MKTVKLGGYIKTVTPKTKIQAKKFLEAGRYPIVSQEAGQVNGYWNDTNDVMHFDRPVIIFGDHTRCIKYIDFNFVAGADGTKILQTPDDLDPRFFYHWLLAHPVEHLGYARHFRLLKEMEIEIPSLEEQRRVVEKLDAAFERISAAEVLMRRNLDNVTALQKSILHKYLSADDSTHTHRLSHFFDVRDGTHDSPTYHTTGYPLVTSKNLKSGALSMENVKYISESDYKKINERSKVDVGDVLMAMIGTIGNPIVIEHEPEFAIKNVALFKPMNGNSGKFLKYYLQSDKISSTMLKDAKGTTQKFVALGYLRNLPFPDVPPDVQEIIVGEIEKASTEVEKLRGLYTKKLTKLTNLRQSLLQEAFSTTK